MMAHWVDVHVGQMIKHYRTDLRLSQGDLGRKVRVSFQLIQKYEIGSNRVSASRLFEIAVALGVEPQDLLPQVADQAA
jgi:transcriptional regulator with XRE-family HTH domain